MLDHGGFYKPGFFSTAVLNPEPKISLSFYKLLPDQQIKDFHFYGSPVIYTLSLVISSAWHTEQYRPEAKKKTVVTFR